ncbi:MAG: Uma2 family endonuclease [bacterium]|nr:Uma2 family endonuclease [bacterium]
MAEPAYALLEPDAPEARWPAQGQWTWDDYLSLPDDGQRYEIIEGVLYASPAPSFDHQFSAFKLARLMADFVEAHELGLVVVAPFDVRLPGVADPVEPDLLFFRTGNQPQAGDKYFAGVPDLIVEVLSPGTSRLDQHVKFGIYEKAGVPEYWLVDPKSRSITVYHLDTRRWEYDELGRNGADETVRSRLLEGFEVAVAALFPPPKA